MKIEQLKKGDLFRLIGKNIIYVYDGYCRMNKKYSFHKFLDISSLGVKTKGTIVDINFEF